MLNFFSKNQSHFSHERLRVKMFLEIFFWHFQGRIRPVKKKYGMSCFDGLYPNFNGFS